MEGGERVSGTGVVTSLHTGNPTEHQSMTTLSPPKEERGVVYGSYVYMRGAVKGTEQLQRQRCNTGARMPVCTRLAAKGITVTPRYRRITISCWAFVAPWFCHQLVSGRPGNICGGQPGANRQSSGVKAIARTVQYQVNQTSL